MQAIRLSLCAFALALMVLLGSGASAQPLDPLDFTSLGTLNLPAGDYTIDTDTLTIFDNTAPGVSLFTGVVDDQNGQADYFNGDWDPVANPGQLGIPEIAVFTFSGIDLQASANVSITGRRAIALLSQGDATIGTDLSVNGEDGSVGDFNFLPPDTLVPGPLGGAGGHAGGGLISGPQGGAGNFDTTFDGEGPGGGATSGAGDSPSNGRPGAFGGDGTGSSQLPAATAYGDLSGPLQGGSGGGSTNGYVFGMGFVSDWGTGGGGGGAIELGARGVLTVDGDITAIGGERMRTDAGSGSGGGIRVNAGQLQLNGMLDARGGGSDGTLRGSGAGGRVFIGGSTDEPFVYTVGQDETLTFADFPNIVVEPGDLIDIDLTGLDNYGVITLRPSLTLVPDGQTLAYDSLVQIRTSDVKLDYLIEDARVLAGGALDIGAGVTTRDQADLELVDPTARITGTGTLFNDGTVSGTGRIETLFNNRNGGAVTAVNDNLTFTQQASAAGGSEINAINSTVAFEQGLNLAGDLNLINSTFDGDLINNGTVSLAGANTFTGTVSGSGTFTGTGTAAFTGTLSPGSSPGQLTFEGDLDLEATATLEIEIAGTTPGSEHDRVEVGGFATLEGALDVTLLDGYVPELGDSFAFLFASGAFDASFSEVNLPDLSAEGLAWELNPGGSTLFLEAVAALDGDFNLDGTVDAADYTVWRDGLGTQFTPGDYDVWAANFGATAPASSAAVPEPAAVLLSLVAICLGSRHRGLGPS